MPPDSHDGPAAAPRPVTILVAEDEDGVREYTRKVLELAGYAVLPARDADEAERLFRADPRRVCALLTDVMMPRRTGLDLARALHAARPGLPVVYMSGFLGDAGPLPAGAVLLEKPFPPERLLAVVGRVVARRHG